MNKFLVLLTVILSLVFVVSFSMMRNIELLENEVIVTSYNKPVVDSMIVQSDAKLSQVKYELRSIIFGNSSSFSSSLRNSEIATLKAIDFKNYAYSLYSSDSGMTLEDFISKNVSMDDRYDAVSDTYYVIALIEMENNSSALVLKLGGDGFDEALYFN